MGKLSDKYIAGFLDADGSIQVMWRDARAEKNPDIKRGYLSLEFSQKTTQDEVLHKIQEAIGGTITISDRNGLYSTLKLAGSASEMVLQRIRKHLVIKRHYADFVLSMLRKPVNKDEMTQALKEHRRIKSLPLPNFPPRKWLAGYFDGDGSLGVRTKKDRNSAQPVIGIAAIHFDTEGIDLIHKVFGGSLQANKDGRIIQYVLTMPPSKAKQFLGYFAKHLITKKDQAYFILGCASMGHYRDGKSIEAALKQLKAHPHRLNEPKPDVSTMLRGIKDISFSDTYKDRKFWFEGRSKEHLVMR